MSISVMDSARERSGNLPVEVTSFVDRRQETAEVRRLLTESRLVTLTGPGGVGKTRLALRVAGKVRRAFPDGVWLVTLADLGDPGLLAEAVAATLGIQDHSSCGLMDTLTEFLQSRHLLLVMDNCEHLVDASAGFIEAILRAAPKVQVLATSRQSLKAAGEQAWPVPPLPVPDLPEPLDGSLGKAQVQAQALACSEAVTLFTERARSVRPGFVVTPDNGMTVARICRRLDGIPLALELAAVRLRALSEEQILQRLDDRFKLLTVGNRAGVSRQQTLRALIDWSYEYCTEAERAVWERASVFSGGFDLAAAEQVCAGEGIAAEDVLDLVDALIDKSILHVDHQDGETRYRMLETIRQYSLDRLTASGKQTVLRRRHRDYFQTFAHTASRQWFGPDQVIWGARLRREHANLRAALEFCLTEPGEAQAGLTIATDIYFFFLCGYLSEGRRWYDRALALVPEPTPARAAALWSNAWIAGVQSDLPAAKRLLRECRTVAEQVGDRASLAEADTIDGWIALNEEDPARAVTLLERALAVHLACVDVQYDHVTRDQDLLANAVFLSGDAGRAIALHEECLAICETHGELWFRAWVLLLLAFVTWHGNDRRRAEELTCQSLRIKYELDDRIGIGHCLDQLAWIVAADHPERAACLLGAAYHALKTTGAPQFPFVRAYHDECVAAVRAALGDKAFTVHFEAGAALTIDEAVGQALSKKHRNEPVAASPAGPNKTSPLTTREQEVATLVAEGLTSKEIAARLVISKRTADAHIEHIMTKLGFTSRTQIAALVVSVDDHGN